MKEATGELNMTVVTVVAIAAVAAFFYAFIWPGIKNTMMAQTVCTNGQNYTAGIKGQPGYISCGTADKNGQYKCDYTTESNGSSKTGQVTCKTK